MSDCQNWQYSISLLNSDTWAPRKNVGIIYMYGFIMQFRAKLILPESAAMIMCGLMAKIVKR